MKKSFFSAVIMTILLIVGAGNIQAQTKGGKAQTVKATSSVDDKVDKQVARWTKQLGLSAEQSEELKTELTALFSKREAIRTDANLNDNQKKQAIAKLQREYRVKIKDMLNPEQLEKYKEIMDKRRSRNQAK